MGQVISLSLLKKKVKSLKAKGKAISFTNGCFDLLHPGHVKIIKEAGKKADILIVGINSDASIRALKGKNRPIMKEKLRAQMVAALAGVDFVVIFREKTPLKLIKAIKPNILAKGADWKEGEIVGEDLVKKSGGEVRRIKLLKGISTTTIISSILKKYEKQPK